MVTYDITLPEAARVRVRVFDSQGRLVRTLLERDLDRGGHHFVWNAWPEESIVQGTYYLRLDAAGLEETRKFVLVK